LQTLLVGWKLAVDLKLAAALDEANESRPVTTGAAGWLCANLDDPTIVTFPPELGDLARFGLELNCRLRAFDRLAGGKKESAEEHRAWH
jgi:hypothetical protein